MSEFTWKATAGSPSNMVWDIAEVRRAVEIFADPENAIELIALTISRFRTLPGSDVDAICSAVSYLPDGIGIYFRVNPLPIGLDRCATDADVVRRRWLYIDVDPNKADGERDNPATESEKAKTCSVCDAVNKHLREKGWPSPIITDSGNGYGMFYRCDLPNDAMVQATFRQLLQELSKEFSGPNGSIDLSIHNASRLAKLPGTWARKGESTEDRPHRPCKLVYVPDEILPVTFDLLRSSITPESPKPVLDLEPKRESEIPASPGRIASWGRAALDAECLRVVLAERDKSGRHIALNMAAFKLGQLIGSGVLDRSEVERRLRAVAESTRLTEDDGIKSTEGTIYDGIEAGKLSPREVPPEREEAKPVLGKAYEESKKELAEGEPLTVNLSKVAPLEIEWLIKDRIPKRFITVFAGRTGVGKSFVSHDLIARMSVGGEIPLSGGQRFKPGGTLIISEDSHEHVLVPRLMEAGADMTRINAMSWKAMAAYSLGDTDMLTRAANEVPGGVSLVLIDPPTNFLQGVDEHKNSEVRALVMKVVTWTLERDPATACEFITHVNKQSGKGIEALNRVMGSVAWVTTSRIAHTFCQRPEDPEQCLWVPLKNNIGRIAKAMAYKIVQQPSGQAKVEWIEEVDIGADEALGHSTPKSERADVTASKFLVNCFREKLEWRSDEIIMAGTAVGVSRDALFKGKKLFKDTPTARKVTLETGSSVWFWCVREGWGPLSDYDGYPLPTTTPTKTTDTCDS